MAAKKEEKKEEPLVDRFALMKTADLIKMVDSYHANTEDAALARENVDHKSKAFSNMFTDVQNSYLKAKRGASKENDKEPAKYALDRKNRHIESAELINNLLLKAVEKEYGADAAKLYKKNPDMLQGYAATKGIKWHELHQELIDNYRNIEKSKYLAQVKEGLAKSLVKEFAEINKAQTTLITNRDHHIDLKKHINKNLQKHGFTLEDTVEAQEALQHHIYVTNTGKLNEEYRLQNDTSFKKYADPNKK